MTSVSYDVIFADDEPDVEMDIYPYMKAIQEGLGVEPRFYATIDEAYVDISQRVDQPTILIWDNDTRSQRQGLSTAYELIQNPAYESHLFVIRSDNTDLLYRDGGTLVREFEKLGGAFFLKPGYMAVPYIAQRAYGPGLLKPEWMEYHNFSVSGEYTPFFRHRDAEWNKFFCRLADEDLRTDKQEKPILQRRIGNEVLRLEDWKKICTGEHRTCEEFFDMSAYRRK